MKNIFLGVDNKLKVRTKLIIGFSVIVFLLGLIGFYTWGIFGNLNRQFGTVEEDIIPDTIAMNEVETLSSDIYREVTDYFYHNMEHAKNEALLKLDRLIEIRLEYLPATTMSETIEHGKDPVLADIIYDFYHSTVSIIDLKERGFDYDTLLAYDRSMILPPLLALQQRANELNEAKIAELSTVKASFDNAYTDGVRTILISAGLIVLLAIATAIFTTRSIVRPLYALRKGTEMIAKGKLDYKVGTNACDEIGELSRAFDQMTQSLSTSMTSIDNLNQEIAGRKRSEQLQNDENRLLTLLGQGAELSELLDAIVRLGESHDSGIKGSVLLFDSSKELLFQAAAPSLPESYLELMSDGVPIGPNMGSCGTAAFLKERVIIPDIKNSPLFQVEEVTHQIIDNGLFACWSQPIISSTGELLGTIANYKNRVGEPSADNLRVLEWSARIAAIAIEHKRAEEALANEAIWRRILIEQSRDGIVVLNDDASVIEANQRFCEMLGYSPEEVLELHTWDWDTQYTREELLEMGRNVDAEGLHVETYHKRKDGAFIDVDISINGAVWAGKKLIFCVCRDFTARKQAEEALRESEERFSKAFHASPGSMSISRLKDGIFLEVNESFLKEKGYTREEVIGHSSAELGIWKDDEHRNQVLQTLREQGMVSNELTQFRTKSGELRTGYLSAEFITLGNEPCMIVLTTDITQLKQAEEQLRLLSSVTQQVSDSTIVIDTNFKITYMNQAAQDLFGYTLEEARGNMLRLFDARPMTHKEQEAIKRTITSGKVLSAISNKHRKDGSTIICGGSLSPLFDDKGEICSYIDVQRDITEQKEVEAKLQVHKQLIERILATMPEGVLVIGSDDRILLANEAFRKIFLTGKKVISNKPLNEIISVKQLHNLYMAVKEGKEENNTLEFRYQVKELEKRIACVITKMDEERMLLTFSDVSQEREEEEKLYLTDRLASIGEMAAGLAHELNNPLTGILALSQLLMDSEVPEECREDLECVYNEAKRAASIVKNVLLFTRNNNYENGRASSNEVVRDVLRLREYEEKVNNITATMKLQEDLPDIPMDKFQLQQVFLNIILNAEAAIEETDKPGKLTVTTERANNHVNIHFKDNGCGIDKHVLPRIFDPFFTTKDIGKGTGLGLSICYGIVVKNGGKISVKSNINKGTTFTVRMPVMPQTV